MHPDTPVYVISVAAKLLGVHPQTLRVYEREGLVEPFRTQKNRRLYSEDDILLLQYIHFLTHERRVNIAGVRMILEMLDADEKPLKAFLEEEFKTQG